MNVTEKNIYCITLGDPYGIGPEIVAKALNFLSKKKINMYFKLNLKYNILQDNTPISKNLSNYFCSLIKK